MALGVGDSDEEENYPSDVAVQQAAEQIMAIKEGIYKKAKENIKKSQKRMKEDYDKKHCTMRVSVFILYMF